MGLWKSITEWFQITGSFVQDYGEYRRLGFKPVLFNGDFILRRELSQSTLSLHQAVEPHNTEFGPLIDFDIEAAMLVVKLNQNHSYNESVLCSIMEHFDYAYHKKNYLFCMLNKMSFEDPKTLKVLKQVIQILD